MTTKDKIIKYIESNGKASVEDLRKELEVSRQIIHRHLNSLVKNDFIVKIGTPPIVYYTISEIELLPDFEISEKEDEFLKNDFMWVSPLGGNALW